MRRVLLGVGLALLVGCGAEGTVSFKYVLLEPGDAIASASCDVARARKSLRPPRR